MDTTADRLEFAPPPTRGLVRAVGLALLAHAVLMAALTWGVHWKRNDTIVTAQAELWSALPQQAAPKLVEALPAPPPQPVVAPPVVAPPPVTPKVADADIALERDKQLRLKKEQQQAAEKLARDKRRQQTEREAEKLAQKKADEKAEKQKLALDKQREAEKLALDKKKNEQDAKRKEALKVQEDAVRQAALKAQREDNLKRMAALAGSTGAPSASGTALQSSGPSSSYGGRVAGKVRPNIVFTEDLPGNPTAEVEVRAAPDGTIVSRKLVKGSGSRAWDEAVLKAIDKTEVLPRDTDGRVPSVMVISFRPKD